MPGTYGSREHRHLRPPEGEPLGGGFRIGSLKFNYTFHF